MIKGFLNNYFGFNRQQRNGLFVLMCISALLLVLRMILPGLLRSDDEAVIKNLPLINIAADSLETAASPENNNKAPALFRFDPNTATFQQLRKLGLTDAVAERVIKMRERKFVFRTGNDLKKVYGLSDARYKALEPYIVISKGHGPVKLHASQPAGKVDINTADSIALLSLPAVGPAFAKRIVAYRSLLGGFVSTVQLKEVYGFTDEMFRTAEPHLTLGTVQIKQLRVNSDDFKTLNRHPYLSYDQTKLICNARNKSRLDEEALREIIADQAAMARLQPYLNFD